MPRFFSFVLSTVLALVLFAPDVRADAQTSDQQKCTNAMNLDWSKVSKQSNLQLQSCVKNFVKGKSLNKDNPAIDTLEECVVDDPKGKIAKAKSKTGTDFIKKCGGLDKDEIPRLPDYGVTDPNVINVAAMSKEIDLAHDIFGSDLDLTLIEESDPSFVDSKDARDAANCQRKVFRAASLCQQTKQKEFLKCKKVGMKMGGITDISGIENCYDGFDPSKIAKKCTDPAKGIQKDVQKQCADKVSERTLSQLFPSCISDDVAAVSLCIDRLVECNFCLSANSADGANRNCDVFDDGSINGSCGETAGVCEVLNGAECLLPWPSTFFLKPDATPTGFRINYPQIAMPELVPPLLPDPFNELDGFSSMVQAMMHLPGGVDLVASNAPTLLPPGCCGQPAGPPWIETRTYISRSLDADSPTLLIKASTGEQILHFVELDVRADGNPARQVLFLRAGESLEPGTRYIVALRNLIDPNGDPVTADGPFAALRDATITTVSSIENRRAYFESTIFPDLVSAGVDRSELVLAFDFITQSDHQLTHQLVAMRDQGIAYADGIGSDPNSTPWTITQVDQFDCNNPADGGGATVWRQVKGTYETPNFLTAVPTFANVPVINVDANDTPLQNSVMDANFDVTIPCSVLDPNTVSRPIVLGHGIFGTGDSMTNSVPHRIATTADWTYIGGGTDWLGLSGGITGQIWVGANIIGLGVNMLNNFPAFVDRLKQGMANQLVLGRMMKLGVFNRSFEFEDPNGNGVFPGPGEEMYYHGISLGGIHGTLFAALTPDVERFSLDVPAANFACLLQRSTQFSAFEAVIAGIGLTDPMQVAVGAHGLIHDLWVSGEPAGFLRHITSDPLPGSGGPAKLMMTPGWLDKQVSNNCTEAAVRTLGIPSLGSVQRELVGIPDAVGPQDSAVILYDTGAFDLFNPAHQATIPLLANQIPSGVCDPHNGPRHTPAKKLQLVNFLRPGGKVENFCTGVCDAVDPIEQPEFPGGSGLCDPTDPNSPNF